MTSGRKTYTERLGDRICAEIAACPYGMEHVYAENKAWMPHPATVHAWARTHPAFGEKLARAQVARAAGMVDQTVEIADDGRNDYMQRFDRDGKSLGYFLNGEAVQRSRLRVETRLKAAAVLAPKQFGAKQQIEMSGSLNINLSTLSDQELIDRIMELVTTGVIKFLPIEAVEGLEIVTADEDYSDLF